MTASRPRAVIALLKSREIQCEELRVWCECDRMLKGYADNCEQVRENVW
jgi:hypothetical protein